MVIGRVWRFTYPRVYMRAPRVHRAYARARVAWRERTHMHTHTHTRYLVYTRLRTQHTYANNAGDVSELINREYQVC